MLVIRSQQMDAFRESSQTAFVERLAARLRRGVADRVSSLSAPELHAFVRRGIARAAELGIRIEWDVCRFVTYRARWGEDFEDRTATAWAGAILQDADLNGTAKMDLIDYRSRQAGLGANDRG
jgi:hypothetical protein